MDKKYNLRLDLQFRCNNSVMKFDEFDINTSDFFIKVTRNKELIDISEAIVTLVAIKPDGTVDSQFVTITENNVYCDLKPSMKDIPGKYEAIASITIAGETINTDPTNPIVYEVTENKFLRQLDAAVISEERFSILTDMINKLSVIQNQENDRVEAEKLREENAKKAIEELNNISKNFDKTIFEKVNAKVDEVIEPVLNDKLPSIVSDKIESIKDEIKGEQGEKGEKGEKGDIGPRGETGPAGPQGERGIQGEIGPKGETGATGQKGENGERGEQGLPGTDGQDGENGITPNITIGTVTTLEPNQQATVTRRGTDSEPIFDFGIPRGEGSGNANIDDTQVSIDTTWSSDKISTWSMEQDGVFWTEKEGNFISVDDTYEYKLKEIEIFGDTWQDENNLEDIQHAGELYVDEEGQPILDSEGREQYKFEIESSNVNLIKPNMEMVKGTYHETTGVFTENPSGIGRCTKDFIRVGSGGKYSYKYTSEIEPSWLRVICFDNNNKFLGCPLGLIASSPKNGTFVMPIDTEFIKIQHLNGDNISTSVLTITKSDTTIPYDIPHKSHKQTILLPCQLMKVGDVKDRLFWDESKGRYVVDKNIIPEVLDDIGWIKYNNVNSNGIHGYYKTNKNGGIFERNGGISSKLKVVSRDPFPGQVLESAEADTIFVGGTSEAYFKIGTTISVLEDFKKYVKELNSIVYFINKTPQIIETNITTPITIPTFSDKTHVYINNSNNARASIKAKFPLKTASAVASVKELGLKNSNSIQEQYEVNQTQDNLIDISLCATDEMYMMIEPLLSAVPQTISERMVSKMVDMYVAMVIRGLKTIDEVPARYREEVKEILAKLEK